MCIRDRPGSENFMEPNYQTSADVILDLLQNYELGTIDPSLVLNINTPNVEFSKDLGYVITSVGTWGARTPPGVDRDLKGNKTYWTTHRDKFPQNIENSDIAILQDSKVSISPINPSFTIDEVSIGSFTLKMK